LQMTYRTCLSIVLLFCLIGSSSAAEDVLQVVAQLNARLQFTTNVIYNPQQRELSHLQRLQPVGQLIISSLGEFGFNGTELKYFIEERVLFVLIVEDPFGPLELLQKLHLHFDEADFLLVIERLELDGIWLQFVYDAWQLGYIKLLFLHSTLLYENQLFPELKLKPTTVERYAVTRGRLLNLHGYETRVAVYSNPPRSLLYKDEWGNQVYGGYYMRFIRQFLRYMNATFVPIQTPSYSAGHCKQALQAGRVDLCADALAQETTKTFAVSRPIRLAYANIMVPSAKPLGSYRYLVAPFHSTTWLLVIIYVLLISGFISFIVWLQRGRFEFGKQLLQILGSLISGSLQLSEIQGRIHYILFIVIALGGLICSTYYLAFLKTILSTGLYEPQINSFEELVRQNISFIVGDYDKTVLKSYDFPDILWNITRVVPYDFITKHRRVFDPNYAYLAHSDRLLLFSFQQQYMMKPRMRPLPIDIMHSLPGFPMRREWLLKFKLSEALLNCFNSGLMQKLAADTNRQTIHIGYLSLMPSERYETQPLALDYFAMPLKILCSGLGLAFICFLCELLWQCA
ncbi:hypothetical protein KR215_004453, partial [Drosophila sulfurigaster]